MLFVLIVAGPREPRTALIDSVPAQAERALHMKGPGPRVISTFLSAQAEITEQLGADRDYWIVVDMGVEVHPIDVAPLRDLTHAIFGKPLVRFSTVIFTEGRDLPEIWPAAWYPRDPTSDNLLLVHNHELMDVNAVRAHIRARLP